MCSVDESIFKFRQTGSNTAHCVRTPRQVVNFTEESVKYTEVGYKELYKVFEDPSSKYHQVPSIELIK